MICSWGEHITELEEGKLVRMMDNWGTYFKEVRSHRSFLEIQEMLVEPVE